MVSNNQKVVTSFNDDYQFKVDIAYVEFKRKYGKTHKIKHALIMLENKQLDICVVHPLTAFIFYYWKHKEYNTQRLQAVHICQFLNFLLIEKRFYFKLNSLSNLKIDHGSFCNVGSPQQGHFTRCTLIPLYPLVIKHII